MLPDHYDNWFYICSVKTENDNLFDAFLKFMTGKQNSFQIIMIKNSDQVTEDEFLNLSVALLAALTYVHPNMEIKSMTRKLKTAEILSEKLMQKTYNSFIETWLLLTGNPAWCINALKATYSLCMSNTEFCKFIDNRISFLDKLYEILQEKVISKFL
jgi:hypothetical protein